MFLVFPLFGNQNKYFLAFTYDLFIAIYYFVYWTIFKNQEIKIKQQDEIIQNELDKQIQIVKQERDEAMKLNTRWLELAKEIELKIPRGTK
jgi:hypothetical protein